MRIPSLKQAGLKLKIPGFIKLSAEAQKLFAKLSENPHPPTAAMKNLKDLPDFASRTS